MRLQENEYTRSNILTYLIALFLIVLTTWLAQLAYSSDVPKKVYYRSVGQGESSLVAQSENDRLRQFQETREAVQELKYRLAEVEMTSEMHALILIQLQADRNKIIGAGAFLAGLLALLQIAQLLEIRRRKK